MPEETYLLIDPVGDQLRPVSAQAFRWVNAPVDRVLARNCVALFLSHQGEVTRIEDIKLQEPSIKTRMRVMAGRRSPALYRFANVPAQTDDLRLMISDARSAALRGGEAPDDWWLFQATETEVRGALEEASSLAELYAAIQMPPPDSCLDLL